MTATASAAIGATARRPRRPGREELSRRFAATTAICAIPACFNRFYEDERVARPGRLTPIPLIIEAEMERLQAALV